MKKTIKNDTNLSFMISKMLNKHSGLVLLSYQKMDVSKIAYKKK